MFELIDGFRTKLKACIAATKTSENVITILEIPIVYLSAVWLLKYELCLMWDQSDRLCLSQLKKVSSNYYL